MEEKKEIPARVMLDDMDVRYDRYGKRRVFSLKFVSLTGKLYYIPRAYAQGAGRMNNKEYRMRGIQPCCDSGNPEGHAIAVRITNILEYNGHSVDWGSGMNDNAVGGETGSGGKTATYGERTAYGEDTIK